MEAYFPEGKILLSRDHTSTSYANEDVIVSSNLLKRNWACIV